ncbi:MAG: hypothetical protein QM582_19105 [Micropruina sp.]|uniref:hypothetical protein n=1 Tax=Micropruina sp. TaxID=2737536 RepID=UPI0039E55C61
MPSDNSRPRRPAFRDPAMLELMGEGFDPIAQLHAAHETAAVLLHTGRAAQDPSVTERLVDLVGEIGLSTLADLWSTRPAASLPGALWRLYFLREWMRTDSAGVARCYAAGVRFTEPNHVVAGIEPPRPEDVRRVADDLMRGVFTGDFAVALERAAAFCRVTSAGSAELSGLEPLARAAKLQEMADDLTVCARLWRAGELR